MMYRILAASLLIMVSPAVEAQQILTAVQSESTEFSDVDETKSSSIPGATVATTFGGANTYATTDFGLNKVFASGNANNKQYATSAWLDSYTVTGDVGSKVDIKFSVSIDGFANYPVASMAEFGFNIYALRDSGWALSGSGDHADSGFISSGNQFESPILSSVSSNGRTIQMDARDFNGFFQYSSSGQFEGSATYDASRDVFITNTLGDGVTEFYKTGFRFTQANGTLFPFIIPYTAAPDHVGLTRQRLEANYSLLDRATLCGQNACAAGVFPLSELTLSFSALAGSQFTILSVLFADDLLNGTIDFYNTAKITGVTVSNGGLLSASGSLLRRSDGSYGFAAVSSVPEPATWVMFIFGVGLIGASMRRKDRTAQASLA